MPDQQKSKENPSLVGMAVVLLFGILPVVFDTTIVALALNNLARELATDVATIQWVTTGYLLAIAMAVPLSAWLVDRLGARTTWLWSLGLFLLGSLAAALAWNAPSLIAARVVQGLAGGIMMPVMQTLLVQAAGGRSLGKAMALVALPALAGPMLGPVIGGLILDGLDWRWIFLINLPLCVVGLALAWKRMPRDSGLRKTKLDLVGLVLLSPGIAALLLGLSQLAGRGASLIWSLAALAAGVLFLAVFLIRAHRNPDSSLVDLRLFRVKSFSASTVLLFLSGIALYGAMLLLPLYCQQFRGESAFEAGLLLVPQGIGSLLSRGLAGKLTDKLGARLVVPFGLIVVILGTLPFVALSATTGAWILGLALVVRGVGLGAVTVPLMAGAYQGLNKTEIPHASILTRSVQQLGGSFGTTLFAVILEGQLTGQSPADASTLRPAFENSFWWSIGLTAIALIATFWLPKNKSSEPTGAPT